MLIESVLNYYGLDWLGTFFLVIGVYLLSEKRRFGFVYSAISNVLWIVFGVLSGSIAIMLLNSGLMVLNLRGYLKWGEN